MEENKVAQKLAEAIPAGHAYCTRETIADFILQSPDLRVTLVEPRFRIDGVLVRDHFGGYVIANFLTEASAREYADFKNSKEPK